MAQSNGKESSTIQSVVRALQVLEYVCDAHAPVSVIEISEALGLSRTTTHGLINTLTACNYIEKDSSTRRYKISPKLYGLSCSYPHYLPVVQTVNPYLLELLNRYNETIHLGIMGTSHSILLAKIYFPSNLSNLSRKFHFPIYTSGLGKAILANLPKQEQDEIIDTTELHPYTRNTITDKDALRKELEIIRKQGYATDFAEYLDNTYCIGFPIFNNKGEVAAAFSISGYQKNIEPILDDVIPDGLQCSKSCSADMGWHSNGNNV